MNFQCFISHLNGLESIIKFKTSGLKKKISKVEKVQRQFDSRELLLECSVYVNNLGFKYMSV